MKRVFKKRDPYLGHPLFDIDFNSVISACCDKKEKVTSKWALTGSQMSWQNCTVAIKLTIGVEGNLKALKSV